MKYSAKKFSDQTGISEKLADKILSMVYEKKLGAEDFSSVLWKIRDWFIKNQMPALLEKLGDEDIAKVIDQVIAERAMWQSQCPADVCCADTPSKLEKAFNDLATLRKPQAAWFFTQMTFDEGKKHKKGDIVRVQIMRTGTWQHPSYGEVKIDKKVISDVVKNFESRERGIDLAVDENHEENHKALAWFRDLVTENNGNDLFADVELTQKGADLLNEGAYKYFSPEIVFYKIDEETGNPQSNLLIGGAFTNRPFFKDMQPLMASENVANGEHSGKSSAIEGRALFFSHSTTMLKLLEMLADLGEKSSITASEKAKLEKVYGELPQEDRSDEINKAFAEMIAKFDDGVEKPEDKPEDKPTDDAKPEDKKDGEDDEEGDDEEEEVETEQKVEASEALVGAKFNEEGELEITDAAAFAADLKIKQKKFAEMQREASMVACEKLLAPLVFSEKRKNRVVLPAHKKTIVAFAASLDEAKRAAFFSILGSLKAVPAGEIGHSKPAIQKDISKPETFSEDDEAVKYFMESFGQDLKTAQRSAADFYATKAKRS